jgi:hypothetical protein
MKKLFTAFVLSLAALTAHAQVYPTGGLQYTTSGGIVIGSSTTLTTSQLNNWSIFTSASAVATLPASSSTQTGATMTFIGGGTGGTIKGAGTDNITSARTTIANTFPVEVGQTVIVTNEGGGNWYVASIGNQPASNNCQNVMDFGADPTNSVNNDSAFTRALAAAPTNQKCLYFPTGTYKFGAQISVAQVAGQSLTIRGDGANQTSLTWPSNGGIYLSASTGSQSNVFHLEHLSLLAGTAGSTGNAAFTAQNTNTSTQPVPVELSTIDDVSIHGADGYVATDYWRYGVLLSNWSNVNVTGLNINGGGGGGDLSGYTAQGIGVYLTASAPPYGVVYNFTDCEINYLQYGIEYGENIQGVTVAQSNFTGGKVGIFAPYTNSSTTQLTVTSSQFNESDYGILDQQGIASTMIENNLFIIPVPSSSNAAISLQRVYEAAVSGNVFEGLGKTNTNGLVVGTKVGPGGVVTGNVFDGLNAAVVLGSGSGNMNVQSNVYSNNTSTVINSGSGNTVGGGSP